MEMNRISDELLREAVKQACEREGTYYEEFTKDAKHHSQSIKVTMKLQKYLSGEWKTLKEWTGSTTGKTYSLSKNYTIATGTYRVRTTFKVGNETVTKNSSSVKR